jgi:hypothetical protein
MQPTSLLVAALLLLRHPCTRNKLTASILLNRAAKDTALSPADREACLSLVDELESDDALSSPAGPAVKAHRHHGWPFANSINAAAAF